MLKRYDGFSPMEAVDFSNTMFWVQIHNLPFRLLTPDVALEIGDTLGEVNKSEDSSHMVGGNFMRICVAIDISQPLCCRRTISFGNNVEGCLFQV